MHMTPASIVYLVECELLSQRLSNLGTSLIQCNSECSFVFIEAPAFGVWKLCVFCSMVFV